jgi:hypothetical protein
MFYSKDTRVGGIRSILTGSGSVTDQKKPDLILGSENFVQIRIRNKSDRIRILSQSQ